MVDSPLLRGGLTLIAGVLTGNLVGFGRVAVTAYFLGAHSRADSLAVAMGPIETLNSLLMNSVVFAFVPMLTARSGAARTALFRKLTQCFFWVSVTIAAGVMLGAPWLMRALAPGLDEAYFATSVMVLRILAFSSLVAGTSGVQCALLYTNRRFAPTAFYQAALNVFMMIGALAMWKWLGVYAFAVGYTLGSWAQLALVYFSAHLGLDNASAKSCDVKSGELLRKPLFFVVYAVGLGLNITFTRAYATQVGPGMAAALDYCMRGVGVPLALLVNPISNSLLPEIARLRSIFRVREALRLIDRTLGLTALLAVAGITFALAFRTPAIALFFQHGNFTPDNTQLVAAVFLGLGPSVIGWSLLEICARSLFALDRQWPPVIAAAIPVLINVTLTVRMHSLRPDVVGIGSSIGLMVGFCALFAMLHANRKRWLTAQAQG